MMLEGTRVRSGIIAKASKDGRLLAIHCPDDLGNKGRILAENILPDGKYERNGFPEVRICGKKYHVIEYCRDYPELMKRYFWFTNSYASAYREV